MKLRAIHLAILSFVVLFGITGMSMLLGLWRSESSKVPAAYTSGKFAGEYNPADIRGSYSFEDIHKAFEVPIGALSAAFGIENHENPESILIKTFEDVYGDMEGKEVGTDSVRLFVALYLSRPYEAEEATGLPRAAIELLKKEGSIDTETAEELMKSRGVDIGEYQVSEVAEDGEDTTIKGKTTFRELLEWGLTESEIEEIIGMPMGPPTQSMRDYSMEQGLEFSPMKTELQKRLDE